MIPVKIKLIDRFARVPTYATDGAACFDISANEDCTLSPGGSVSVSTGLSVAVPSGHALLIYSRSGHAVKYNVRLTNCVGVIDSDYRGEVRVLLTNDSNTERLVIKRGDRIAQGMIVNTPAVGFDVVDNLPDTARGCGGFGSTGNV